jgi:hypothetical protein
MLRVALSSTSELCSTRFKTRVLLIVLVSANNKSRDDSRVVAVAGVLPLLAVQPGVNDGAGGRSQRTING